MAKVKGTIKTVEVEIGRREIANAVYQEILYLTGIDDDAGCDWFTTKDNKTFIGGEDWFVSDKRVIAYMVNTMNYLRYGRILEIEV